MAKGSGSTKSVGASGASAARTNTKSSSMNKAQVEGAMGISEKMFFNTTGYTYGHPVSAYESGLEILNKLPDNADLFTGHKAGEAKDYLKKIIKILS